MPGNKGDAGRIGPHVWDPGSETFAANRPSFSVAIRYEIDESFRSAQHRQQTQQQHLSERINHLAALARVWHVPKIIQKNNGFTERPNFRSFFHPILRNRIRGSRQIQQFSPLSRTFFTRLPWPPGRSCLTPA
jgi:hypothetical protein